MCLISNGEFNIYNRLHQNCTYLDLQLFNMFSQISYQEGIYYLSNYMQNSQICSLLLLYAVCGSWQGIEMNLHLHTIPMIVTQNEHWCTAHTAFYKSMYACFHVVYRQRFSVKMFYTSALRCFHYGRIICSGTYCEKLNKLWHIYRISLYLANESNLISICTQHSH